MGPGGGVGPLLWEVRHVSGICDFGDRWRNTWRWLDSFWGPVMILWASLTAAVGLTGYAWGWYKGSKWRELAMAAVAAQND